MRTTIEHFIRNVVPLDEHRLWLHFSDGRQIVADLAPVLAKGGVFQPLSVPDVFRKVKLENGGRAIVWPGGVDLCADALYGPKIAPKRKPIQSSASFGIEVFFP
jgi:hypothetical protein